MTKQKKKFERFFTITTPRKDGSILDQFLDEFGYSAFEKEDRSDDTRRSVQQIAPNEELIAEVADFCKDNKCKMQLIYKRGNQLVQQTFQSDKAYSPKPYGASAGQKLAEIQPKKETQNVEQKIQDNSLDIFLTGKEKQVKNSNQRNYSNSNKNRRNNKNNPNQKVNKANANNPNQKVNKANANNPNQKVNKANANNPNQKRRKKPIFKKEPELKQVSDAPEIPKTQNVKDITVVTKRKRTMTTP